MAHVSYRSTHCLLASFGAAAICTIAIAQPTTFSEIPPPSGYDSPRLTGLSADGTFVAFTFASTTTGNDAGFRWSLAGGYLPTGFLDPVEASTYMVGISPDGSTLLGVSNDNDDIGFGGFRAVSWTPATGLVALPVVYNAVRPDSSAFAASSNNSVIIGNYYPLVFNELTPFRIDNGVFSRLPLLPDAIRGIGLDVSADGSRAVGYCSFTSPSTVTSKASLWYAGGVMDLGPAIGATDAVANAISADGRTIVADSSGGYPGSGGASIWKEMLGMRRLAFIPSIGRGSNAMAVSADGSLVGGRTAGITPNRAALWRHGAGYVDLADLLATQGIDISAWSQTEVNAVSDDGLTVAGTGFFNGATRAWIVRNLPPVPPMTFQGLTGAAWTTTQARAISAGGGVVAGLGLNTTGDTRAFRWTPAAGLQALGTLGGNTSAAYGISADGLVVAGTSNLSAGGGAQSFRWTASGGLQNLGTLSGGMGGTAYGVNEDGSVIVGRTGSPPGSGGGGGPNKAYRWTAATGMTDLGTLGQSAAGAFAVNALGTHVTGISGNIGSVNAEAFRWTSAGMTPLATGGTSIGRAISNEGSIIVGENTSPSGVERAFYWVEGFGTVLLNPLPSDTKSGALTISSDSVLIGGYSASPGGAERAVVWHPVLDILDLNQLLPALGVDLTGWTLTRTWAVDLYGVAMAGDGVYNGQPRAWAVRNFRPLCAPVIAASPADQTACLATTVVLTAASLGFDTAHEWRKGGVPLTDGPTPDGSVISGSQTAQLTITGARAPDTGSYACVLSNPCGQATTPPATLTICISDFNCDLFSDAIDYDEFIGAWLISDAAADVNGDGFTDALDYDSFITGWLVGC